MPRKQQILSYNLVYNLVDQIIKKLRQDKINKAIIASSDTFGAHLYLVDNGQWQMVSPMSTYYMPEPVLVYDLLAKFARLEDPLDPEGSLYKSFQDSVGFLDYYDTYETYHKRTMWYVHKYRQVLLDKFVARLKLILTKP